MQLRRGAVAFLVHALIEKVSLAQPFADRVVAGRTGGGFINFVLASMGISINLRLGRAGLADVSARTGGKA